jgi:hypothetical protein
MRSLGKQLDVLKKSVRLFQTNKNSDKQKTVFNDLGPAPQVGLRVIDAMAKLAKQLRTLG